MKINNFKLDWLSFTYFKENSEDLITDFFSDFPEFEKIKDSLFILDNRKMNYQNCLSFNDDIMIRFDNQVSNKGVNVQVPSHGLNNFINLFGLSEVASLFRLLSLRHCRPSRIDLCFDDFSKTFMPKDFIDWHINDCINTRILNVGFFGSASKGYTFYMGARGKKLIRIYDKDKESGGEINAVRYEFELHREYALSVWNLLINDSSVAFGDLINDSFKIVNRDDDVQMCRCSLLDEWEKFLKSTLTQNYIEIPHIRREVRASKVNAWLETQVFNALKFYVMSNGFSALKESLQALSLSDKYKRLYYDLMEERKNYE